MPLPKLSSLKNIRLSVWNCVWPLQPGLYTRDDTHRIQWLKWRRLHRRPWWCPAAQTRGRERGCCDASCYQSVRAGCCQRWSTDPFLENNVIGVKVVQKMTLDKLKKTPYLQSCKILDLIVSNDVNFTTCNSHRMGRPNVYVNYLLAVQRSWLNRSVGINFFHLVWGVRFLSVGYFIQAEFVKPGRKKKIETSILCLLQQQRRERLFKSVTMWSKCSVVFSTISTLRFLQADSLNNASLT